MKSVWVMKEKYEGKEGSIRGVFSDELKTLKNTIEYLSSEGGKVEIECSEYSYTLKTTNQNGKIFIVELYELDIDEMY